MAARLWINREAAIHHHRVPQQADRHHRQEQTQEDGRTQVAAVEYRVEPHTHPIHGGDAGVDKPGPEHDVVIEQRIENSGEYKPHGEDCDHDLHPQAPLLGRGGQLALPQGFQQGWHQALLAGQQRTIALLQNASIYLHLYFPLDHPMPKIRQPKAGKPAKPALDRKHGATRDSILDAGLKLFSERGFEGVSVKDLEAEVGLTPGRGSFYRHFESKEALLAEVVHREVEKVRTMRDLQQRAISGSLGDRRAELIVQYRLALIGLEQIKALMNLLAREYGRFPELMKELSDLLVEESLALHTKDLQRDIANRQIQADDAEALAAIVQSALVGYHLSKTFFGNAPYGIENDRFVKALANLLLPASKKSG